MSGTAIVLRVVEVLEEVGIAYMLVGSFSSNIHGVPRLTEDADFVVEIEDETKVADVARLLGGEYRFDPQLMFETVTGNLRYVVAHPGSGFTVELFLLSKDPHHVERWKRKVARPLSSRVVYFQSAEDVIIQKLRWYGKMKRSKDRDDVVDVIDTQREALDMAYIRQWTDSHGTTELLEGILGALGM
jgi:hypothetical protein